MPIFFHAGSKSLVGVEVTLKLRSYEPILLEAEIHRIQLSLSQTFPCGIAVKQQQQ